MGMIGRWISRLLASVVIIAVLLAGGLWFFLEGSLAQLDGQARGPGLSSLVTVTRDANGVPSIAGQNRADVAFATGYVHGQERFFQMDLMRRSAAGELAEIIGPVALPVDRDHRFHRFRARAEAALLTASAEDRLVLQRYCDGVNAGLQALSTRPADYLLTLTKPRPWTPADSLLVSWAIYFDLQGDLESREWALGWLKDHLTAEQFTFLLPDSSAWDAPLDGPSPTPTLSAPGVAPNWWTKPAEGKQTLRSDDRIFGSNNWAIAGSRSANGLAIIANDMHLSINLPPIWYRALLSFRDEQNTAHNIVGVTLPGTPLVVVGSNGHVAWGFTNAAGDWLTLERLDRDTEHSGQVRIGDDWVTPTVTVETILVKDAPAEKLVIRETDLGPLREKDGQIYAVHWIAHLPGAVNFGLRQLETVTTSDAALRVGAGAGLPALNMLAGDEQGHIGWTIAGAMPERDPAGGVWRRLLATASHPRILDPASGQLQTANSRQLIGSGSVEIGDGGFDLGARTRQIRDDLQALGTAIDTKAAYGVVLDDRALFIDGWRQRALAVLDDSAVAGYPQRAEFKRLLSESWDNEASTGSVGYRLARGFLYALYDECFVSLNDQLGKLDNGASYRLVTHRWPVVIEALLAQKPASWLPAGRKDWRDVQLAAIDKTIASLTEGGAKLADASWGQRNRANIAHPFAKFLPLLRPYLSAPPDMLAGDSNMPRVAAPNFGPTERLTVAPGKEEEGIFNMPGGESGHPLSPFYLAGHEDWVKARPTPLLPGAPKYGLVLTPG
jgi:penicillin amidase